MTSWPLSKAEWIRWLDKEQATYENALRLVKVGVRRAVNVRVTPHPDGPQKDPAIRLKPHIDTRRPAWALQLSNGWHALRMKDRRPLCHICRALRRQACCFRTGPSCCAFGQNQTAVNVY